MFLLPGLADAKGRKFSLFFGFGIVITGIASSIAGIYTDIPQLILFAQFMNGTFCAGVVVLTYILAGEFCNDSVRQVAILFFNAVSGLGDVSFYFLYTYVP
jgi:MFS family permease